MDTRAYLERINYHGALTMGAASLRSLHLAHLMAVPFENFDIWLHHRIILDEDALFDKIVRQRRGGICYELNGLFGALLRELHFSTVLLSAGVYKDQGRDQGTFGPEFDHMALAVSLEQRWLVDVGFGDGFHDPLLLDEPGEQRQYDRVFRVAQEEPYRTLWRLEPGKDWIPLYHFTLTPHLLAEFAPMSDYQQTSPDSHFINRRICTRATATGQITLTEHHLKISGNGQEHIRTLSHEEDYVAALRAYFGIALALDRE